ncbi:hypothetical protein [Flavobacterium sp. PL002]|uniref:hypothetical protein n=1 Tax=Flavobacterium sp. PL002 TaxID=1897058 RepID=UPI001787A30A|nr:hypothetical protein [Flavobacterium sp. PL002]
MPRKFEIGGGSCYQGITAMFIRLILEVCAILNIIALILLFKSKINAPKTLSVISLIIWSLISFFNFVDQTTEDFIIRIKYFTPFLIVNILIILIINQIKKTKSTLKVE